MASFKNYKQSKNDNETQHKPIAKKCRHSNFNQRSGRKRKFEEIATDDIEIDHIEMDNNNEFVLKCMRNNSFANTAFNKMGIKQINAFIEQIWNHYRITSNIDKYQAFIHKTKGLIVHELYEDMRKFEKRIESQYNEFRRKQKQKHKGLFNLKLRAIGSAQNSNQFVVNRFDGNSVKYLEDLIRGKDRITFLCQCTFEQLNPLNIVEIIKGKNYYFIDAEYINMDRKKQYFIIEIYDHQEPKYDFMHHDMDLQHIQNCSWTITENYPILLYHWQMKYCKLFVQNCIQKEMYTNSLSCAQSVILHKSIKQCESNINVNKTQYDEIQQKIVDICRHTGGLNPNPSQIQSIINGTISPMSFIHGPPGTGKTSTCGYLIHCLIQMHGSKMRATKSGKIFVCAYTHNAVNELLRKIIKLSPNDVLRLGNMDKVPKDLKQYTFKYKWKQAYERMKLRYNTESGAELSERALQSVFDDACIIIGTVYSAASKVLELYMETHANMFSYLIMDEVTQILDPATHIPFHLVTHDDSEHIVFIGDHHQLPPVIKSVENKKHKTIFESVVLEIDHFEDITNGFIRRMKHDFPTDIAGLINTFITETDVFKLLYTLLEIQYRMKQELISFSNKQFYKGRISSFQGTIDPFDADTARTHHIIDNITNIGIANDINIHCHWPTPIYVIHLTKAESTYSRDSKSWTNQFEAEFINRMLENKLKYNATFADIGIISLYRDQTKLIRNMSYGLFSSCQQESPTEHLLIGTADAFQGKERDYIFLCLTRTEINCRNPFLNNARRLNVALTRCKKALIVVCSFDFQLKGGSVWHQWFDHFNSLSKNSCTMFD